jgi:N-acetylneuraminate synthase
MVNRTLIIAEAGVNHNGSIEMAFKLIEAAATAGADYVKFQTFKAEEISVKNTPMARYQSKQVKEHNNQYDMLKSLELDSVMHKRLFDHCKKYNIKFLSTPFDPLSLKYLCSELNVEIIKIPSGEITNPFLLLEAGKSGKPIILSTGMATLADIEMALGAIAFASLEVDSAPTTEAFRFAFASAEGQKHIRQKITLLHCTTEYPTRFEDVNLRAIATLNAAFGVPAGLSDHTNGVAIPIAAVARGAAVIEKHFTLDRNLPGPDHAASLEPNELKNMISSVRQVELAIGNGQKIPVKAELENAKVAKRSLVAAKNIKKGELFTEANIKVARPGSGITAMNYWNTVGLKSTGNFAEGDLIKL